ncbi:hypothetical protein BU23DRAFT_559122 [Bimuria novae-zelandiae CBS 107.79]|uniref:F-box domain-containing protein n=1 Tax=Bimuria novae-zelandiae CBS 107.79 TaxID=1447943 RepID=A0A6A5UY40_9PLEO|nr:hypothetical protein BU23DRAFT_559122 [Bimuria novae-zelandiae CBS 107.79]
MVGAIAYGNWELPIDANIFGIQSTWQGELRIPFACHIRQPSSTAPPNVSFHQFARLPAELQLRVLRFCDKPTLFQLMQTSHLIRIEATKLFFSDPEAWYCVEGEWLEMGGHPSDVLHDIDFLRCIQRLHVECGFIGGETWTDQNIRNFWRRVQCLFPQAKYVMLGDNFKDRSHHPVGSSTASWPPPELHRRVCQLCPPDINVFVSILRRDGRLKRTLWRRVTIQEDDNETQELDECQNLPGPSIIVPHKPFCGQVGTCQYLWSQDWAIIHEKKALRVLRLAAIERYHFYRRHEAFACPAPNCDTWFERPEEYTTHIVRTARNHDDSYVLPEPYQSLFADGEERLEQLKQRHREILEPFLKWWGKFGSEERKVAEKEFLRELEHNPLHGQGEQFSKQRWLSTMQIWEQE